MAGNPRIYYHVKQSMHIITIMEYHDSEYIDMCKIWLYLVRRFNPHAHITVFYKNHVSDIQKYVRGIASIHFKQISISSVITAVQKGDIHIPDQFLRLALWEQSEKMMLNKYIYVDADAFILAPLTPWWKIVSEKPYIAVAERFYRNITLYNAGIHSYCSSDGFITASKLLHQYELDGKIKYPTGEQGLINAYFERISYSPRHSDITYQYNCISKRCRVAHATDADILVHAGRFPLWEKIYKKMRGRNSEWWENWFWWGREDPAKILHAFGDGNKFWQLPECNKLWSYLLTKI